jgi:hypothetical protein
MKKTVLALLLLVLAVPMTSAQTIIQYRRPNKFLSVEGGASLVQVNKFDGRAVGGWHPFGGISFEAPMNKHLDIGLHFRYLQKSFTGVATEASLTPPPSHDIHSIHFDVGANWYPFVAFWYLGAYMNFGGNILAQRIEPDGSKVTVPASSDNGGMDALGMFLGYTLETGFSFHFWPIGDRFIIFARYEGYWGFPFNKKYCEQNDLSRKARINNIEVGVRIPISLVRD